MNIFVVVYILFLTKTFLISNFNYKLLDLQIIGIVVVIALTWL